jgi:predicted RNA-binding Zn-ribbon protein involved in translation (DUF1610 family)
MADGLSLTPTTSAGVFDCPNCRETIEASAQECRFCGITVDPERARELAERTSNVGAALTEATRIRTAALAIPVLSLLSLPVFFIVPPFAVLGAIACAGLTVILPFWALGWWGKFADIESGSRDYLRARKTVPAGGLLVLIPLGLFLLSVLIRASRMH